MVIRALGMALLIGLLTVFMVVAQDDTLDETAPIEAGRAVYLSHGCIACHGVQAEGTTLAPPLAETSEVVIRRQIRAPLGIMPNFPPESISAEELDVLVIYLLTLEPFDDTLFEGERLQPEIGEEIIMRHWMALIALEVDDIDLAREHVEFIMQYVRSTHRQQMQIALDALDNDDVHNAQHIIESMVADVSGINDAGVALRLILSAVRVEDLDEATHHLEHYRTTTGHDETIAATIETLLANEEYAQVESLLDSLLEIMLLEAINEPEHDSQDSDHESDSED